MHVAACVHLKESLNARGSVCARRAIAAQQTYVELWLPARGLSLLQGIMSRHAKEESTLADLLLCKQLLGILPEIQMRACMQYIAYSPCHVQ
jgi:hypothetical protein